MKFNVSWPAPPTILAGAVVMSSWSTAIGGTFAKDGSTRWLTRPTDTGAATWRAGTPTAADTITWTPTAGVDTLTPALAAATEGKFSFLVGVVNPVVRVFTGYNSARPLFPPPFPPYPATGVSATGNCTTAPDFPSTVTIWGSGRSRGVGGAVWGINFQAIWWVNVAGAKGLCGGPVPPPRSERWDGTLDARDPWSLFPSDFEGVGNVDAYFQVSIEEREVDRNGRVLVYAKYRTAAGLTDLMSIDFRPTGTEAVAGPSNLFYYLQSSTDDGPPADNAVPVSLASVAAAINADMQADGRLDQPIYLGMVWRNIPRPVVTMSGGAVAEQIVGTTVTTFDRECPCIADVDDASGLGSCDGGVGIEDLLYYLSVYDAGAIRADVDDGTATGTRDGGVGIEDLLYYLVRYDAGC
jgi:hypothetical protein